ncbi:MAG: DUF2975 domain-containing protein [Niameybacter sp.]|uniref:DUF2975 domain-containing protein n=1 Tax=Niameybacter sp. TaxID=2033640 RepID=UPI002FC8EB67
MKNDNLSRFLYGLCVVGLVVLSVTIVGLPWIVNWLVSRVNSYSETHTMRLLMLLYTTGIPAWIVLWQTKDLAHNIILRKPFSRESKKNLKVISLCAFFIFVAYSLASLFIPITVSIIVIIGGAFMVALIGAILYKLVDVAIEIQEENELTI